MSQAPDDDDDDLTMLEDDDDDFDDADLNEGIFNETKSIFNVRPRNGGPHVDHTNPVITQAQENAELYVVKPVKDVDAPDINDDPANTAAAGSAPLQNGERPNSGPYAQIVASPAATALATMTGQPPRQQLVAQFDDQGRAWVAKHVNGKQVEKFHPATIKEAHALKTNGKLVKGGFGVVDTTDAPMTILGYPVKKVLLVGGGLAAVAAVGWWVYKKNKADADADVDEVD